MKKRGELDHHRVRLRASDSKQCVSIWSKVRAVYPSQHPGVRIAWVMWGIQCRREKTHHLIVSLSGVEEGEEVPSPHGQERKL